VQNPAVIGGTKFRYCCVATAYLLHVFENSVDGKGREKALRFSESTVVLANDYKNHHTRKVEEVRPPKGIPHQRCLATAMQHSYRTE